MRFGNLILIFLSIFLAKIAFAYPELSRHGYTNCTSCHLSPSGGGLLTTYGRELSKEILSTWANEGEQYFAYGQLPTGEKVLLGAYVRGLQALRDDSTSTTARTILMQADAEGAYNAKSWAIDASVGREEVRSGLNSDGIVFSRRHFLLYRLSDTVALRAGKFLKFYGLNDPNHYLYVRKDLNFGFDTETYNLEASYLGPSWSTYLTLIGGSMTDNMYAQVRENGVTGSVSYFFTEKQKVGLSFYLGEDYTNKRWVGGPWMILSFTPAMYLLSELDFQTKNNKTSLITQTGYVTSNRLNYEWVQGIITFLSFDKKYLDSSNPGSEQNSFGIGTQLFPRPHFELMASWQKEQVASLGTSSDLYWLLVHFYL